MGNTDIFQAAANEYDTPERIKTAKIAAKEIRGYITDGKYKTAVDFGCGTGLVGMELVDDFKSMIFLDTSENMLEQVNKKIEHFNVSNAGTLCFDFEAESKSDIHADYIFMVQVLLHINDIEPILSRLYEVLNPGGHLIIVDFDKNENVVSDKVHNGFVQEELIQLMTKIGFKEVNSRTFYTGSKMFMNQDASIFILDSKKI